MNKTDVSKFCRRLEKLIADSYNLILVHKTKDAPCLSYRNETFEYKQITFSL